MSQTSAPFGFRPSFHNSGQIRPKAYTIESGYGTTIFSGDPVKLIDTGTIVLGTVDGGRGSSTEDVPVLGIFAGCQYNDASGRPVVSPFWPQSVTATEIVAWVYDDPETLFNVQYDNPSPGDSVQVAVGQQCNWFAYGDGGSTQTGLSTTRLDAIYTAGPAAQFQIVGFAYGVNDSMTDAYVVATVRVNQHQYKAAVDAVVAS